MTVEEWKQKNLPIQRKHITNADRIRSMSDEELANFLYKYIDCTDCPIECDPGKDICLYKITAWLKEGTL